MNKTMLLSFLILGLLSTMILAGLTPNIQKAKAEVVVDVKVGNWIRMNYTVDGSGYVYPEWIKVEILSVEGTDVNVALTMHMPNGTEADENLTLELGETSHYDTGGNLDTLFGFGFLIPANSTVGGDYVYITLLDPSRAFMGKAIEGEASGIYAGANRTVIYTSFRYIGGRYGNSPLTYYWDKQTGVIVKTSATLGGMHVTAEITETNIWEGILDNGEEVPFWMQWWLWAIISAAIVALVGGVYFLKKRQPPTSTVSQPTAENMAQEM